MRKFIGSVPGHKIISPPPLEDTERPIDAEDNRIMGFGLRRQSKGEQLQVEAYKLISSLLRCNTSMQTLVTPIQAKVAMFYTCKYWSKDPFELSSTLSQCPQAQISIRKWGSTAANAKTASSNANCLMQKMLNKIVNIEVLLHTALFLYVTCYNVSGLREHWREDGTIEHKWRWRGRWLG